MPSTKYKSNKKLIKRFSECFGRSKTFANRVYHQLNHDLVKTQRAMGHKNINSTVAYLSFVEDEIDQAILAS